MFLFNEHQSVHLKLFFEQRVEGHEAFPNGGSVLGLNGFGLKGAAGNGLWPYNGKPHGSNMRLLEDVGSQKPGPDLIFIQKYGHPGHYFREFRTLGERKCFLHQILDSGSHLE